MTAICCHRRYAIVKTRQPEVRSREFTAKLDELNFVGMGKLFHQFTL